MIRRLAERGVLKNENATVSSLVSKAEVQRAEMEELMEKTFEGSLPAFLAAFCSCGNLTEEESRKLAELIRNFKE